MFVNGRIWNFVDLFHMFVVCRIEGNYFFMLLAAVWRMLIGVGV